MTTDENAMIAEKRCSRCDEVKSLEQFSNHVGRRDGKETNCRECRSMSNKIYRKENATKIREYRQAWYERNSERVIKKALEYLKSDRGREKRRVARNKRVTANPLQARAQYRLWYAKKTGKITPTPCEACGEESGVQAHHDDYERALDVRWLCTKCHARHHSAVEGEG